MNIAGFATVFHCFAAFFFYLFDLMLYVPVNS